MLRSSRFRGPYFRHRSMSPSAAPPSIAKQVLRGAFWTAVGQYALFAFGIGRAIILARLVDREYFGLVAGAVVWSSYLSICRLDLRMAALGSRENSETLDTQFLLENLSAAIAFPLTAVLWAIWPEVMTPHGWIVILVLLAAAQFDALTSTAAYLLDKRLRQDITGRVTAVTAIGGFVVPVAIALAGYPLTALAIDAVWPMVVPRACALIFAGWWPGVGWSVTEIRQQIRLGGTLWSIGVLGKITFQFDDWLVFTGRRPSAVLWRGTGVEPEALYDRAYGVSKLPMDLAGGVIASNALAIYSERAAHGRDVLHPVYRRMTWALAWIIFASGTYLLIAIDDLVYLLGAAWVPMVPLARLMILFTVARPLLQNCAQILLALKRERDVRRATLSQAIFLLVVCPPAVYYWGAAGAAVAVSLMSVVGLIASERYVTQALGSSSWPSYVAPATAAVLTVVAAFGLASMLPTNVWAAAFVKAMICGAVFPATMWLVDRTAAVEAWRAFRRGWFES